jgi:hypothetical protein
MFNVTRFIIIIIIINIYLYFSWNCIDWNMCDICAFDYKIGFIQAVTYLIIVYTEHF